MRRAVRISKLSLSAAALGLFAFAQPTFATDDAPAPEAVQAQADDLRQLFEAASKDGLVQLRDRPEAVTKADEVPRPKKPYTAPIGSKAGSANCMQLAPLFDGGQGGFENGFYVELATDVPQSAKLAATLAQLIDLSYADEALPVDLSSAGNCGGSFLPWQALADPARALDADTEARLAGALGEIKPALRRQVGVQIAIRAGLADNLRLSRRVADALIDAGLHGTPRHDADIEHVLLDAILTMGRDPIGARARLDWVADRSGPEQLIAVDLLDALKASASAQADLQRMTESPVTDVAQGAHQRLLAQAIRDRDMGQLNALMTAGDDLSSDPDSVARLSESLSESLGSNDALKAIHALDLFLRLDANGVAFGPDLRADMDARLNALANPAGAAKTDAFASTLAAADNDPSDTIGGASADRYIGSVSDDLTRYREVLDRG